MRAETWLMVIVRSKATAKAPLIFSRVVESLLQKGVTLNLKYLNFELPYIIL